jgi:hypothetical protein
MRAVAHGVAERELLMKMHQRGNSLSALSRETGTARPVGYGRRLYEDGSSLSLAGDCVN